MDELRLVCERCGVPQPLAADFPRSVKEEIRRRTGFTVETVCLEASGECRLCAAKKRAQVRRRVHPGHQDQKHTGDSLTPDYQGES